MNLIYRQILTSYEIYDCFENPIRHRRLWWEKGNVYSNEVLQLIYNNDILFPDIALILNNNFELKYLINYHNTYYYANLYSINKINEKFYIKSKDALSKQENILDIILRGVFFYKTFSYLEFNNKQLFSIYTKLISSDKTDEENLKILKRTLHGKNNKNLTNEVKELIFTIDPNFILHK